jgi:glycosyltransferase involved in cell wall biosynthesis
MSPTRVLYVQPSELFGGAERQAATVLPQLAAQGLEVTALVGPGETIVDWLHAAGIRTLYSRRFPRDWAESRGLERIGRALDFVRQVGPMQRELRGLLDSGGFDLVVGAMPFSWVSATSACRERGIPIVWRAGGTELSGPQRAVLARWAPRHPPDALVCNSEAVRAMFAPLVPAPARVIRNGVDTDLFFPGARGGRDLRPPGARVIIGFAGRLVPQKRPQDFLAMAQRLAAHHPDVSFLVAGDGSRLPSFRALAAELGLRDRVHFLGIVADMRAFYAACDLLVLPSRSEGCPNIVLEAMAMKVPVVASDAAATREVVSPMRDGLLFPVGDVDRLVEAVERLIVAPDLRATLATRALRKVQTQLSATASARALADLIHTLMPPTVRLGARVA